MATPNISSKNGRGRRGAGTGRRHPFSMATPLQNGRRQQRPRRPRRNETAQPRIRMVGTRQTSERCRSQWFARAEWQMRARC
eukprot:392804-Pyramimonas_sp.AAC.1